MFFTNTPVMGIFQEKTQKKIQPRILIMIFSGFPRGKRDQKICLTTAPVLYYSFNYCFTFYTMGAYSFMLGMSDPWVAAAYCANIAVTLFCVVYGIVCYNSGDDSGEAR